MSPKRAGSFGASDRRTRIELLGVRVKPGCDVRTPCVPSSEDQLFLLVGRRDNLGAVQEQERRHRVVADALVAVDERVVLDQRGAESGGFVDQGRVKVLAVEGGSRLGSAESNMLRSRIPDAPPLDSRSQW
jgi:hypothetical protein